MYVFVVCLFNLTILIVFILNIELIKVFLCDFSLFFFHNSWKFDYLLLKKKNYILFIYMHTYIYIKGIFFVTELPHSDNDFNAHKRRG